jgi:hypothetical protein
MLMSLSRSIQWYHSHADPIWPDGTFNILCTKEVNMDACMVRNIRQSQAVGAPLPIALEMDLPASKSSRLLPYKHQVH